MEAKIQENLINSANVSIEKEHFVIPNDCFSCICTTGKRITNDSGMGHTFVRKKKNE